MPYTLERNQGWITVSALTAGNIVLERRPERIWAVITNISPTQACTILLDDATGTFTGLPLYAEGSSYTIDRDHYWDGAVYALRGAANGAVGFTEVYWRKS